MDGLLLESDPSSTIRVMADTSQFDHNPLHGIREYSDINISKYEWLGISREGYAPMGTDKAIQVIIAAERERCARIAESWIGGACPDWDNACEHIALAIRINPDAGVDKR